MDPFAGVILAYLISLLPQILIGAMGLALVRSRLTRSFRKARRYGTIGFSLLLLHGLLTALSQLYIRSYIPKDQVVAMANAFTISGLLGFLLMSAALVFLLLAVFADRKLDPAEE